MAKNHLYTPQTIDADDDDTDICPVCDGQCTCQKQQRQQPSLPSLKIKLTVPQSLIAKHLVSSNNAVQTTSVSVNHGYIPRKRGRPPKSSVIRPRTHAAVSPLNHKSRPSSSAAAAKIRQNTKARAALAKRATVVGRRKKASKSRKKLDDDEEDDEKSSLTSLTDVDMDRSYPTSHFPTFVSASALESFGTSSDSDSDLDNDSSGKRDKERERARTRRELLGDDPLRRKLGHPINNEWVIRSRKTSVDLSEAEGDMDVDSDSDEEDDEKSDGLQDEEEPEDENDDAGAETTMTTPLIPFLEAQDSETTDNLSAVHPHQKQQQRRRHFVRLGKTGWSLSSSEDEESAFDAELFFRYLYDSSASSSSSSSVDGDEEEELTEGQDNDDGLLTSPFLCPPRVESLPFELAESWDGGVVFTNGEGAGSGDVAVGFVEAERLGRGGFGYRGTGDSDVEMDMRMGIGMAGCASCLEDGYLEEDGECEGDEDGFSFNEDDDDDEGGIESYSEYEGEGGSGDTTDEDLVGSDSLPNERAMSLFKLPLPVWGSVSAVDPLSLVSSRPRRELEMMEVVEGVGEKRRRGKGKNKGKGRMRRETREKTEKGGRERRKEGKKRREMLPSPLDILEGRGTLWSLDDKMGVSEEEDEEGTSGLSSASGPFHRGHKSKAPRSPRTPTPTPTCSPTTPVPATPALSTTTTSFTTGPRKGVFVVPTAVSEWTETGKRKGKAREKAMVIIAEDRNGENVPSPHPRKRTGQSIGGSGDGDVVEQLLKRHLVETLGAADVISTVKTASPLSAPLLGAPFSPVDDIFSSSPPTMRAIQLADVLDAEFLKDDDKEDQDGGKSDGDDGPWNGIDQEVKGGLEDEERTDKSIGSLIGQSEQTPSTPTPSDVDLAADAAAVKNLSRWDVISVAAFRQTQQQVRQEGVGESAHHHHVGAGVGVGHGHVRTPGSSTDYGNAMKKSGKFALGLLWRGGTSPGGKGVKVALSNSPGSGSGVMRRTPSGGMIGSIHAKKRKLMMSSSSTSVMKEPLVLPATSISAAGGSNVASSSTAAISHVNGTLNSTNANPTVHGKTRKEARRERKLHKRNASQPYNSHSLHPHSHHHHQPQHMYHTHYHHPNAKTRGVGSSQRLGGWFVGGGSGSGGGGGGAGGWGAGPTSGSSGGVSGGFGGLSF